MPLRTDSGCLCEAPRRCRTRVQKQLPQSLACFPVLQAAPVVPPECHPALLQARLFCLDPPRGTCTVWSPGALAEACIQSADLADVCMGSGTADARLQVRLQEPRQAEAVTWLLVRGAFACWPLVDLFQRRPLVFFIGLLYLWCRLHHGSPLSSMCWHLQTCKVRSN